MDLRAFGTHGTFSSNVTDLPALASILETDTLDGVPGTYHEALTGEVQYGVTFGPSQSYTGTYGQSAVGSEDDIIKNLFTAIYSRFTTVTNDLNTDISGRMYKDVADEGATFPYVVVSLISDVNLYETFNDDFYDVYIQFSLYSNSTAGSAEIENMYSHLKELYDNCTIAPTGSYFYWMRRESATRIDDDITTENGNSHVYGYAVDYYIKIEKH